MMDAGFFKLVAGHLRRLPVPVSIADDVDIEVRRNFRLAHFMESGFLSNLATDYYAPPHWQNFIIKIMYLLYDRKVDDHSLMGTLRVLSECGKIDWDLLFKHFRVVAYVNCDSSEDDCECSIDSQKIGNQILRLIRHKDEIEGC